MYKRITYDDRLIIEKMYKQKLPVSLIAKTINKSRKSVYAELKKGFCENLDEEFRTVICYSADKAQKITDWNVSSRGSGLKIDKNHTAAQMIENLILKGYSPYAVSVILKRDGVISLSKNTIYNYIYSGLFLNISVKNLISGRRKRTYNEINRKHRVKYGTPIDLRPPEVDTRSTFGHWEMDTVQPRTGAKACFLVLTERYTRYELISKLPDKTSHSAKKALSKLLRAHKGMFKTITCDNGSEFASVSELEKLGTNIYFAHPNSAFERGSNENQNRFIRRRYPKGTDFEKVTAADVLDMQAYMNTYPRAIFGGLSAADVYAVCNARA